MSQYTTGTVAVTNGNAAITGTGTAWLDNITEGSVFTLPGSGVPYVVGSVNSDTSITLSSNYAGATDSGLAYSITTSYTPAHSLPYPEDGDSDTSTILKRAMLLIDTLLTSATAYADSLVVGLLDDRGNYDASVNTYPASGGSGTAGAIMKGDIWYISVAGTLGGTPVIIGDTVRALADTPGQTAGNWVITASASEDIAANFHAATTNATPADASEIGFWDSTATALRKMTFAQLWTWIQGKLNFAANVATFLTTPSSANLKAALTDETGSGAAVFATEPSLVSPSISGTSGNLYSSSYTPTVTNGTNVAASTAYSQSFFTVIGGYVLFDIPIVIDPTAVGEFDLELSLPVASTFSSVRSACGSGCANVGNVGSITDMQNCTIYCAASGTKLFVIGYAADATQRTWRLTGRYAIE